MISSLNPSQFFDNLGLLPLTQKEVRESSQKYLSALRNGLRGDKSSLQMFRSCLDPVDLSSLQEGASALIVEVGGSNLYGAWVAIRDQRPVIIDSYKTPLVKIVYENAADFFTTISKELAPLISQDVPDAMGIVYSFAGRPFRTENGVDVQSVETLTKEFVIPGISKRGVGVAFVEALSGMYPAIARNKPVVVLNDTVATLFSGGASIGGVVGTGFNLALNTPFGIVNSESGSFDGIPSHHLAEVVDKASLDPGKGLAEKQVSGVYLSQQLKRIVQLLADEGVVLPYGKEAIGSETISELLSSTQTDPERVLLKEGCLRLRDRSAQIVGMMIGTIFSAFPETYLKVTQEIPIEGSVFWNIPGYREEVEKTLATLTSKKVTFLNIPEAGRLGAAVAALSFVK